MVFNNGIRIQYKIPERIGLFFIPNGIREDIRSHDKKGNEKEDITTYWDKTDIKKEYTRELRTRILKETINISGRQEQEKRQTILETES